MLNKKILVFLVVILLVVGVVIPVCAANPSNVRPSLATYTGSGFFITPSVVVTSNHVVRDASRIEIIYNNEIRLKGEVLAFDEGSDLALLKVSGLEYLANPLILASSHTVRQGSRVYAVGFPLPDLMGVQAKLSEGIISSTTGLQGDLTMYQISTPVQPGNSGGPLLNERAEVIGVVAGGLNAVNMFRQGILPQNVNYAVKINNLFNLANACEVDVRRSQPDGGEALSAADVMDIARQAVVLIVVAKAE